MNMTKAIFEILIMLIVAFGLGFLLAWLLFSKKGQSSASEASNADELKLKDENELLKKENTNLKTALDKCVEEKKASLAVSDVVFNDADQKVEFHESKASFSLASQPKKDDLKVIEGVGPKIESLLNDIGVFSYASLSETNYEVLRKMLDEAGPKFKMHDPSTWPKQAKLASEGKWEELKFLQDSLDGGRDVVS